jgi:PHD/YefM family antitoxin component YafN of YafNO toxin-antitoxin module
MFKTASITALRDNLAETIDTLNSETAVLVVRHSKPAAYLVAPEFFESLIDQIEDLIDMRDMEGAIADYHSGKAVDAEEAFQRLGL